MPETMSGRVKFRLAIPSLCLVLLAWFGYLVEWSAQAQAASVEYYKLDNGLQVAILPIEHGSRVTAMVWYRVGATQDPLGSPGLAHFVEHATFGAMNGDASWSGQSFDAVELARVPEPEAFTSYDYTAFYYSVALQGLEEALQREAERMTGLRITEEALWEERQNVIGEIYTTTDHSPKAKLHDQMHAWLFRGHPYSDSILGSLSEVKALSAEEADRFYGNWYAPNNAILVIAGKVNPASLVPVVERAFGTSTPKRLPAPVYPKRWRHGSNGRVTVASTTGGPYLWAKMFLAPGYGPKQPEEIYSLQVLAEILAHYGSALISGGSGLAQDFSVEYDPFTRDASYFSIEVPLDKAADVREFEEKVNSEMKRFIAHGLTKERIDEAKEELRHGIASTMDDPREAAEIVGRALALGRTVDDVLAWPDWIAAVTPDKVVAVAKQLFFGSTSVVGVLRPEQRGSN